MHKKKANLLILSIPFLLVGLCACKTTNGNTKKNDDEESENEDDNYDPTGREDVIMITEAGTYTYTGEITKQIYINAPDAQIEIALEGAALTYSENSPIYVATCDSIDISAKKNTTNVINDNREVYTQDEDGQGKGAIMIYDGDLDLKGKGSLIINANYRNGVHCKDDVTIKNLSLTINAQNHGVKGNDSITVESGTLNIVSGGDGLHSDNSDISSKGKQKGCITINGGTQIINSWGDAIDAAFDAVFEELDGNAIDFTAKTNKYSSYDGQGSEPDTTKLYLRMDSNTYSNGNYTYAAYINETWYKASYVGKQNQGGPGGGSTSFSTTDYNAKSDAKAFNAYYDMVSVTANGSTLSLGNWSNYSSSGPGGQEGNNDKAEGSAKGIKAANEVQIISGTISLKTYDDGIHANNDGGTLENGDAPLGNVVINGGNITVDASDDGIHADGSLAILGGVINVTNAYEGLEGNIINISGGQSTVFATDDGVNASSGNSLPQVNVSGGLLDVTVNSSGDTDGIDSNGSYYQTGGVVIVRGPGSADGSMGGGAFALDAEKSIGFEGGTIAIFGGIERTPSTGSKITRTICSRNTISAGNYVLSLQNSEETYDCYLKYSTRGCVVYSEFGTATLN